MRSPSKRSIPRSEFLKLGAAGAVAAGLSLPSLAAEESKRKGKGKKGAGKASKRIPIGLQLYSVRHQCKEDLPAVLEAVAKMGYAGVEFAGYYDRSAEELKKMLKDNGLVCCGTHAKFDSVQPDNLKATIEFNKVIGNKYLIVPSMRAKTIDEWKQKADFFNELAETLKADKMMTGYHAHGHDFEEMEGQQPWHVFFGNTNKNVIMQLDTGNCMKGGADPLAVLKQYPGRATTIHLKEYGGPKEAVIGGGEVQWKEIFDFCEKNGTKWYIVEHERGGPDPVGNVKLCLDALKAMGK